MEHDLAAAFRRVRDVVVASTRGMINRDGLAESKASATRPAAPLNLLRGAFVPCLMNLDLCRTLHRLECAERLVRNILGCDSNRLDTAGGEHSVSYIERCQQVTGLAAHAFD